MFETGNNITGKTNTLTTYDYVVFFLILILYGAINIAQYTTNHVWGGDFIEYIVHALNIMEGEPYNKLLTIQDEDVLIRRNYPPGFPILLIPLIQFFGVDLYAFKFLNLASTFLMAGVCLIYLLRHFPKSQAFIGFIAALLAPGIINFQQVVYSDLPFTALCFLTILLFERWQEKRSWLSFGVIVALCMAAYFIRSIGITLFLAFALYLVVQRRRLPEAGILIAALLLSIYTQRLVGASSMGYLLEFEWKNLGLQFILNELAYSLGKLSQVFLQAPQFLLDRYILGAVGAIIVLSILVGYFYFQYLRAPWSAFFARITVLDIYFAAYFAVITIWHAFSAKVGEPRFMFPLILPIVYYTFFVWNRMAEIVERRSTALWFRRFTHSLLAVFGLYFAVAAGYFVQNPPTQDAFALTTNEAYEAVKTLTDEADTVAFFKPTVISYATERKSFQIHAKIFTDVDRFWRGANPDLENGALWLLERKVRSWDEDMSAAHFEETLFPQWDGCLRWENSKFRLYEFQESPC